MSERIGRQAFGHGDTEVGGLATGMGRGKGVGLALKEAGAHAHAEGAVPVGGCVDGYGDGDEACATFGWDAGFVGVVGEGVEGRH